MREFGGLHILVNAAGTIVRGSILEATAADFDEVDADQCIRHLESLPRRESLHASGRRHCQCHIEPRVLSA